MANRRVDLDALVEQAWAEAGDNREAFPCGHPVSPSNIRSSGLRSHRGRCRTCGILKDRGEPRPKKTPELVKRNRRREDLEELETRAEAILIDDSDRWPACGHPRTSINISGNGGKTSRCRICNVLRQRKDEVQRVPAWQLQREREVGPVVEAWHAGFHRTTEVAELTGLPRDQVYTLQVAVGLREPGHDCRQHELTPNQRRVLELWQRGVTNSTLVAEDLGIARADAYTIQRQLGLRKRGEIPSSSWDQSPRANPLGREYRREALLLGDKTLTLRDLFIEADGICYLCGRTDLRLDGPLWIDGRPNPRRATLDHVRPLSAGGDHSWGNAGLACWPCNMRKRDRDLRELRGRE